MPRLPGRRLAPALRRSVREQAVQAQQINQAIADGNAMAMASATNRANLSQRVTALEARPLVTGGKLALAGMKGSVSVNVPLTVAMPDAEYFATATLHAGAGLLTTGATVDRIAALTTTAVTVQITLGALLVPTGAFVHVVAVKG